MGCVAPCEASALAVGFTLTAAAVLDYRYRDVEPALWVASGLALAPVGILCAARHLDYTSPEAMLAGNVLAIIVALSLYAAGLLGGGDLAAVLLVSIAVPAWERSLLPPSLLTLLYGSMVSVAQIPYMCASNLASAQSRRSLRELQREKGVLAALSACATSLYLTLEEALSRGWLYPSKIEVGGYSIIEREPPELLAPLAAERGLQGRVWVTPGMPQVVFIATGLALAWLLGDAPLRALAESLART